MQESTTESPDVTRLHVYTYMPSGCRMLGEYGIINLYADTGTQVKGSFAVLVIDTSDQQPLYVAQNYAGKKFLPIKFSADKPTKSFLPHDEAKDSGVCIFVGDDDACVLMKVAF